MTANGLIITADDFGLHQRVNEAVALAHRDGVLTAASLMITGPAAADAVAIARELPELRVGLHVVLADGPAALPWPSIDRLVSRDGRFGSAMVRDGVRFFLSPRARAQLAAEIRAQFDLFAATGLALDHVNAHKHFHLHPTVLGLILDIGAEYGMRAARLPAEPGATPLLRPWLAMARRSLDRKGLTHNDFVFGLTATGRFTEPEFLRVLADLPPGVTEIYLHPATPGIGPITPAMWDYRHALELAALLSPRVRAALTATGVPTGGFLDLTVGNQEGSGPTWTRSSRRPG